MKGEQQRELDRICDAFEYAHREMEESPQWFNFLAFGSRSIQPQLAYELIRLDQFYARAKGQERTLDQYLAECSDFGRMVRAALRDENEAGSND